jgi:hypothetical protein
MRFLAKLLTKCSAKRIQPSTGPGNTKTGSCPARLLRLVTQASSLVFIKVERRKVSECLTVVHSSFPTSLASTRPFHLADRQDSQNHNNLKDDEG